MNFENSNSSSLVVHRRRRSIIREFCLNTSTHALPGIARSQSIQNRIFWSISFVCFTGIMGFFIVQSIRSYFDYSTSIDLNIDNEWPQYFPSFSFCNAGAHRLDLFLDSFLNFTRRKNLSISNDTSTWTNIESSLIRTFFIEEINQNRSFEYSLFNLSILLYRCHFNGQICSSKDFSRFYSSSFGLCFTFNAKLKNSPNESVRFSHQNGGNGELIVELYVHRHQYLPLVADGVGIVGLVHDNTEFPLIESTGIYFSPGRKHKIGYRKRRNYFLSSPYSDCTEKINRQMEIMLNNYENADYQYSKTVCMKLCEQSFIFEQCQCVDPTQWNARSVLQRQTNEILLAPLCQRTDPCFRNASNQLFSSETFLNEFCSDCSKQCSIVDYSLQLSSFDSPLDWQINGIKSFVENSSVPLPTNWSNEWKNIIKENFLSISLVRETTIVETKTQTASQGPIDLLSNIGGQTGLWIGISFLSLMEVLEMIYRLIRFEFHRFSLN